MRDRCEYRFVIRFSKVFKHLDLKPEVLYTLNSPFLDLINFNREYNTDWTDFKFRRLENYLNKIRAVEINSNIFEIHDSTIICSVYNEEHILNVKALIGDIFDIRQYATIKSDIVIANKLLSKFE